MPKTSANAGSRVGVIFARRLREAREARRWRQQDLADAMSKLGMPIDRTTLAKIEKGQREVRLDELVALAAALDIAPLHLFLPIEGDEPVRLAPKLTVDQIHARQWARGRRPLDPANFRFYRYQTPGDAVNMEGISDEDRAEVFAELEARGMETILVDPAKSKSEKKEPKQ